MPLGADIPLPTKGVMLCPAAICSRIRLKNFESEMGLQGTLDVGSGFWSFMAGKREMTTLRVNHDDWLQP